MMKNLEKQDQKVDEKQESSWFNSKLNLWSQESERPPPDACFHIFAALAEVKENVDGMKLLLSQSFPEKNSPLEMT